MSVPSAFCWGLTNRGGSTDKVTFEGGEGTGCAAFWEGSFPGTENRKRKRERQDREWHLCGWSRASEGASDGDKVRRRQEARALQAF